ncbi:MAG TPA: glycosyltransferase family 4 protein, partial [Phaeodactylibacter sp.]|nr:glycosyltransferase family 4 protein [Phaeodactylibacter sp.]
ACLCIPRLQYAYTVGEMLAARFTQRYGTPFAVVRNLPYRRADTQPLPKAQPPVILYQGALNEGRGLEAAIDAMQYIEGAQLWLAGEGDLSEALRQKARSLGLDKKVRFLGYLPPQELRELTPKAYIGLNLLENKGLSYYYSLANKAFDYLQAGVPAIHMDFPEYAQLHKQHPAFLLLEELSAEALADQLRRLLEDQVLYDQLRYACQAAADELNWEREEEKLLAFWKQVLHRPPR